MTVNAGRTPACSVAASEPEDIEFDDWQGAPNAATGAASSSSSAIRRPRVVYVRRVASQTDPPPKPKKPRNKKRRREPPDPYGRWPRIEEYMPWHDPYPDFFVEKSCQSIREVACGPSLCIDQRTSVGFKTSIWDEVKERGRQYEEAKRWQTALVSREQFVNA